MPTLNARVAFTLDESKLWSLYASSTFTSDAPATNVQHSRRHTYARTTDTTSGSPGYVRFDSGSASNIDPDDYIICPLYVRHDGTAGDLRWRVRFSDNPDLSLPTDDSGTLTFPEPWASRDYAHDLYNPSDGGSHPSTQYVGVDFWDANSKATYIDIGRIYIGQPWQPALNIRYGSSLPTPTEVPLRIKGSRGQLYSTESIVYMASAGKFIFTSESEARSTWLEIISRVGANREILYIQDPTDTVYDQQSYIYGRFDRLWQLQAPNYEIYSVSYSISEIR